MVSVDRATFVAFKSRNTYSLYRLLPLLVEPLFRSLCSSSPAWRSQPKCYPTRLTEFCPPASSFPLAPWLCHLALSMAERSSGRPASGTSFPPTIKLRHLAIFTPARTINARRRLTSDTCWRPNVRERHPVNYRRYWVGGPCRRKEGEMAHLETAVLPAACQHLDLRPLEVLSAHEVRQQDAVQRSQQAPALLDMSLLLCQHLLDHRQRPAAVHRRAPRGHLRRRHHEGSAVRAAQAPAMRGRPLVSLRLSGTPGSTRPP